jgi:uncharacterized protein (DUF305 family)
MRTRLVTLTLAAALACLPGLALSQTKENATKGSKDLHSVMMSSAKQSQSMPMSGDIDRDFLTMMRHHHQSGIRMAEVEMRDGKDSQTRELARKIVDGQKKELAEIDKLLAARGAAAGSSREHAK